MMAGRERAGRTVEDAVGDQAARVDGEVARDGERTAVASTKVVGRPGVSSELALVDRLDVASVVLVVVRDCPSAQSAPSSWLLWIREKRTLVVHEHGRLHVGRQLELELAEAARRHGESLVEGVLPGRRSDGSGRVDVIVVGVRGERVERRVGRHKLALSVVDRELLDLRRRGASVALFS